MFIFGGIGVPPSSTGKSENLSDFYSLEKITKQQRKLHKGNPIIVTLFSYRISLDSLGALSMFPKPIIIEILQHLDVKSLAAVSRTSWALYELSKEEKVWVELCRKLPYGEVSYIPSMSGKVGLLISCCRTRPLSIQR